VKTSPDACNGPECTNKSSGSAGAMDDQIGHISNQISSQSKVEEHVEDVKYHLSRIHRMQITIASGSKRGYRPIYRCNITNPQTPLMEIFPHCKPNPCVFWVFVACSKEIIEARSQVHCK